ncbi:MAG: hypothetical protein ACFFG0_42290 [Candidatus Thorarchaeota archaeon]
MAILENILSQEVLRILKREYEIFTEVPLYNRCIDAVLLKGDELITIEFKIKDWRRGVRQIKTHLLAADYSYLCMPERKIPPELIDMLSKIGAGLWLLNIENKKIIEPLAPQRSFIQQPVLKEKILKYLPREEGESGYTQAFY